MAYKLTVIENKSNIGFQCKYENLARAERPAVEAKNDLVHIQGSLLSFSLNSFLRL
jgi:hypothetical protein